MNSDVATVLEPLNEHFEAVFGELISQPGRFYVVIAKVRGGVILPLSGPNRTMNEKGAERKRIRHTVGLSGVRESDEAGRH